jgi:hypothetical protein
LVNFCEGVEHDTLVPYIDPIFERLLKLLAPGENKAPTKRYVQEQAITSLAMVADASESTFVKVSLSRLYAEREERSRLDSTTGPLCLCSSMPSSRLMARTTGSFGRRRWSAQA